MHLGCGARLLRDEGKSAVAWVASAWLLRLLHELVQLRDGPAAQTVRAGEGLEC